MSILGLTFRDKITGFRGVATGQVEYLTGCNQVLLAPPIGSDGKPQDAHWFDVQRLARDYEVERIVLDNGPTPGCDVPAPKR